jgi:hypothetical protein
MLVPSERCHPERRSARDLLLFFAHLGILAPLYHTLADCR